MANADRRSALVAAYTHAAEIVSAIDPGQLSGPTACPAMDVAGLVDHIVGAGHRAVGLGRGETPTSAEFPHIELGDAPGLLRQAGSDAEAAWADEGRLTSTVTMPWGEVYTGATLVDMYLGELTTHAWDLAAATGHLDQLDPALARVALTGAQSMLKPEYRNLMGQGEPFGDEVPAPADADDWDRLAAFMGRSPRPASA